MGQGTGRLGARSALSDNSLSTTWTVNRTYDPINVGNSAHSRGPISLDRTERGCAGSVTSASQGMAARRPLHTSSPRSAAPSLRISRLSRNCPGLGLSRQALIIRDRDPCSLRNEAPTFHADTADSVLSRSGVNSCPIPTGAVTRTWHRSPHTLRPPPLALEPWRAWQRK